jgi:trehalose 6-phosphate phosphatase
MAKLKPLWQQLEPITTLLGRSHRLCVATDFDGTLTPIVEHPDRAVLDKRTRDALAALIGSTAARVAVVSGRRVEDLRDRLEVRGAYLAGVAGLEALEESGRPVELPPLAAVLTPEARADFEAWCAQFPGAWIEEKGPAVAIHYRAVDAPRQPAFCAGARRRLSALRRTAQVLHNKKVYEVLPAGAPDKAAAIQSWYARDGEGGALLFFGDDANDEPVHELVRRLGGIAAAVGRTASRAEFALDSPIQVTWFLEWLAREWEITRARPAAVPAAHA